MMSSMTRMFNLAGCVGQRLWAVRNGVAYAIRQTSSTSVSCISAIHRTGVHSNHFRPITTTAALFEETPIKMPALSPTMSAGTIVKWHKKEGDKISPGDVLCEIQTDKAVMSFEFDDEGVLAKILVDENSSEINVGTLIAIICGEDDDWKNVKVPSGSNVSASTPTSVSSSQSGQESSPSHSVDSVISKIAPSARNLLHHYGIDSNQLKASGFRGTLLKDDVLKFISDNKLTPKTSSAASPTAATSSPSKIQKPSSVKSTGQSFYVDKELTSMRRTIAKRLTESKNGTPHAYMTIKCFMDDLIKLRAQLKSQGMALSVNDMIVKACGLALKQVPEMNSQWDNTKQTTVRLQDVDISIAVATPTGLITPIIRNANRLNLAEINLVSKDLIVRAKDGKLQPNEFVGGSFSISNLGMFDIDFFTGVINPPQAAILAVGSTKPVFVGKADNPELKNRMACSLSYDARVVDEETVALFLEKIQSNLEQPDILLHSDGTSRRRLASLI